MPTLQEVENLLNTYKEKVRDREEKQARHEQATATLKVVIEQNESSLNAAKAEEANTRQEWLEALQVEHEAENQFEAAVVEHEPPAMPE